MRGNRTGAAGRPVGLLGTAPREGEMRRRSSTSRGARTGRPPSPPPRPGPRGARGGGLLAREVAGRDRDARVEATEDPLDRREQDVCDRESARGSSSVSPSTTTASTSMPFASAFAIVVSTATGSMSTAVIGPKPRRAAAIERTPEPQPTSSSDPAPSARAARCRDGSSHAHPCRRRDPGRSRRPACANPASPMAARSKGLRHARAGGRSASGLPNQARGGDLGTGEGGLDRVGHGPRGVEDELSSPRVSASSKPPGASWSASARASSAWSIGTRTAILRSSSLIRARSADLVPAVATDLVEADVTHRERDRQR